MVVLISVSGELITQKSKKIKIFLCAKKKYMHSTVIQVHSY